MNGGSPLDNIKASYRALLNQYA